MRIHCLCLAALGIAACSQAPETQQSTQSEASAQEQSLTAAQGAAGESVIPARFHGVWDFGTGSCALESDSRMEITGGEIAFYESIGTVTAVASEADHTLVTLAMEGEGETWSQVTRLTLKGEGDTLELFTSDGEKPFTEDAYPSERCSEGADG